MARSLKKLQILNRGILIKMMDGKYNLVDDVKRFENLKLRQKVENIFFLRTFCKNFVVDFSMVGLHFLVYNGKFYKVLLIKEFMVGFRLGEFLLTKSLGLRIHIDKKKK